MSLDVDLLVVGAGFAGAVLAERCSTELGWRVLVVERRGHTGGNAYDAYDRHGILLHCYGPHWFRTNSERIRDYLSRFTEWHPVAYRVLSCTGGRLYKFPINLDTFNAVHGTDCTAEEMQARLDAMKIPIVKPANSEEAIISQVGWELYRMFFEGYTRKQWGCDPRDLDPSVCGRIPIRTNRDDRYFTDSFQALPKHGYHHLFDRLLASHRIEVRLNTEFCDVLSHVRARRLIYSGPVDAFFGHRFGALPYRSLHFEPEHLPVEHYQPAMQVNYPNDHAFTRIVEIKHATGQVCPETTIVREYPSATGDPFYPIPTPANHALYAKYAEIARALEPAGIHFVGRLATYRYYNMDQVVGMALAEFEKIRNAPVLAPRSFAELVV